MAKIDNRVQDFLDQKRIAVMGVSDIRETGCNLGYRKFEENDLPFRIPASPFHV